MSVAYLVKRYPRFSETFVVTEILAHEAAGLPLEIFSLRPPVDTHFQDGIARVRAPVSYLPGESLRAPEFWAELERAAAVLPGLWARLGAARGHDPRDVYQAVALAREVRQRALTHIHAHFASSPATVARLAAHFAGVGYSFTAHAKDIYHDEVRPDELRRKLAGATAVVTVSDYNLAHLRRTFGRDARRVRRIYNGLDLQEFAYTAPLRRAPRIVAVGRLVEKKGFAVLLRACALLAQRGRAFTCALVGSGPLEAELRAQVAQWGLERQVELLGARPRPEVIRHLREAAAFAAPCVEGGDGNRDGLPTVLLEAMALGTPCVATDVTGIPEVLRDGETGLHVAQHAAAALADALERLLADAPLRVALAARARRLIEAEFDIHRNAAAMRALFPAERRADAAAAAA